MDEYPIKGFFHPFIEKQMNFLYNEGKRIGAIQTLSGKVVKNGLIGKLMNESEDPDHLVKEEAENNINDND